MTEFDADAADSLEVTKEHTKMVRIGSIAVIFIIALFITGFLKSCSIIQHASVEKSKVRKEVSLKQIEANKITKDTLVEALKDGATFELTNPTIIELPDGTKYHTNRVIITIGD